MINTHGVFNRTSLVEDSKPVKLSADELIASRFKFCLELLKHYISYGQQFEAKTKSTLKAEITPIMNEMVEKYNLGGKFVSEVNRFLIDSFQFNTTSQRTCLVDNTTGTDDKFDYMSTLVKNDIKSLSSLPRRFTAILG